MVTYAQAERAALADALLEAGPDAPTLCEGWTAHDLVAHVVARETRPDSGPGILVPAFAGWTEKVRRKVKQRPFADLVAAFRSGPPKLSPFALPGVDGAVNLTENFVHCEDVRRGSEPWTARELDPALEDALWRIVRARGRFFLRRSPVPVTVLRTAPDGSVLGRFHVGGPGPQVTLAGPASELTLYLFGRTATLATVDGPAPMVEQFRTLRLGL